MKGVRGLVGVVLLVSACGGGANEEEAKLRQQVRQLQAQRDALRGEVEARERLARRPSGDAVVALAPADLARAYQAALPLEFDASLLAKEAGGTVVIERIEDAVADADQVHFTLRGKGRNLEVKVFVPPPYDKMAKQMVDGLEAGLELRVRGRLFPAGDGLDFMGRCESARLAQHGKDDYHRMICGAVNDRLLNRPHHVTLSTSRRGAADWALQGWLLSGGRLAAVLGAEHESAPVAGTAPRPTSPRPASTPGSAAPSRPELARHCAQVLEQLARCKDNAIDVLLEERARESPQVAGALRHPSQRGALRTAGLKQLEQDASGTEAQRVSRCTADLRTAPSHAPRAFLDQYAATPRCWDKPCRDRVACLRPFIAEALASGLGGYLR